MIFELAGDGAFDGPVSRVVNPGGHFVDEQRSLMFKELEGEDADVLQGFKDAVGGSFGRALNVGLKARGGGQRQPEDTAAMMVFNKGVDGGFAVAGADREDGEFASEGDETLEDERDARQLRLGFGDVVRGAKNPLAFAVVAHARSFQNGGKADCFYGGVEFTGIRYCGEFGTDNTEFAEERFLREAVLRGFERSGRRIDRYADRKSTRL